MEQRRQRRRQLSLNPREEDNVYKSNPPHLSDESDDNREDPAIPSNQLAAGDQNQAANNNSQPPEGGSQGDAGEDDLENWGILTQYIGPSTKPKDHHHHREDDDDRKELAAKKELDGFKRQYAQDADLRDRARNHLKSLNRAIHRGRTPRGLSVDVQPNCVRREDPTLKAKWAQWKAMILRSHQNFASHSHYHLPSKAKWKTS